MSPAAGTYRLSWGFARRIGTGRAICRTFGHIFLAALALVAIGSHTATSAYAEAMVVPGDEKPKLKACEQRLCTMILKKEPVGEDLACNLSKTWAQETLKGGESKAVRWGFGDARCKINLSLARSEVVAALTQPEYTLNIPAQAVKCEVDRNGEIKPITATLAPKLVFKNGQAEKVWINLKDLKGPADIKGTVWAAAKLEDSLGLFHGKMIKSINRFMYKRCGELYSPRAIAIRKLNAQKRRAAAAAAGTPALPNITTLPQAAAPASPPEANPEQEPAASEPPASISPMPASPGANP